jgi:predicted Zn-dependent protease
VSRVPAIVVSLIVLLVVIILRSGILGGVLADHPPPRQLPPPVRPHLTLETMGAFPVDQAGAIAERLRTDYGLDVVVVLGGPPDPAAFDSVRGQYLAERLLDSLESNAGVRAETGAIIGLIAEDIYPADQPDWRYVFGMRRDTGIGIVSSARTNQGWFADTHGRTRKMVTRYVGFLVYGLAPTSNPGDILFDNVLGPGDLDRMSDHL